jgi:hypothetical protein
MYVPTVGLLGGVIGLGTGVAIIASASSHELTHQPSHLWGNVALLAAIAVIGPLLQPRAARSFGVFATPLVLVAALICLATGQWAAFGGLLVAALLTTLTARFGAAMVHRRENAELFGEQVESLQRPAEPLQHPSDTGTGG